MRLNDELGYALAESMVGLEANKWVSGNAIAKPEAVFNKVISELGIKKLPDEYMKIVTSNEGGVPVKKKLTLPNGDMVTVLRLLPCKVTGKENVISLSKCFQGKVKAGTFPIMAVSGDNYLCYNTRGRVVLLQTNNWREIPVGDSLTEVINKLK